MNLLYMLVINWDLVRFTCSMFIICSHLFSRLLKKQSLATSLMLLTPRDQIRRSIESPSQCSRSASSGRRSINKIYFDLVVLSSKCFKILLQRFRTVQFCNLLQYKIPQLQKNIIYF